MRHPASKPVSPAEINALPALMPRSERTRGGRLLGRLTGDRLSRTHRWLLTLLGVALLLTALSHPIERLLGGMIASRIPSSWVYSGSIQSLQRLDAASLAPSQLPEAVQMQIRSRFAALRMPTSNAPLYELVFRRSDRLGPISFALAGGQIVVTDAFVAQHPSEEDLMNALTLQLGHLQHRHALRAITDHSLLSMVRYLVSDDASNGIRLISQEQPVLQHDEHCVAEARSFAEEVMRLNPPPNLALNASGQHVADSLSN
ncbi:hypothetical protein GCM10025770_22260 [Viridibacterium curvum]|uniref:Peptidase M48 domain-containing protein n=2 Tax=Viridibacterium curvum TaxID=1101404 RepID=A0ABP9QRJ8_9RHOO